MGGFVKGWGEGRVYPTPFSQSIWRELATKIRFEVSLTAVFNPSRHTFYPSPEQQFWFDTKNNSLWTFLIRHKLTSFVTLHKSVCINPRSVLSSVFRLPSVPPNCFVGRRRRRNHDFRQRNGELNHFSRMSHLFRDTIPLTTFTHRPSVFV